MIQERSEAEELLFYQLCLTLVPGIGDLLSKNVVSYCGGVKEIFKTSLRKLERIPGIGPVSARSIKDFNNWQRAEKELEFIRKNKIRTFFYLDDDYPARMKMIPNTPVLLYYKGNTVLNASRVIAIVGTRKATNYGISVTERFVEEIAPYGPVIVSGLAYGIDAYAHKAAMKNGLSTVGVLGHGLNILYPSAHRSLAVKMLNQGGLLTEFMSGSDFDKENFPKRNRIVAAMCDAIVLVESAQKGGALITAELGNIYNKDVFAFPGRAGDPYSGGCNYFIKQNKAALIENAADMVYMMGWENTNDKKEIQVSLFLDLDEKEIALVELLKPKGEMDIDEITFLSNMNSSSLAATLLNLEFKGVIKALPGKVFKLM